MMLESIPAITFEKFPASILLEEPTEISQFLHCTKDSAPVEILQKSSANAEMLLPAESEAVLGRVTALSCLQETSIIVVVSLDKTT